MPEASPATGASESAETKVATESAAQTVTQDVKAESSPATQTDRSSSTGQADKPASMLDAIKAVGAKTAAASPAADGGQTDATKVATGADAKDPKESDEELPDDPTEEELARYHSRTRARILKLVKQRDEVSGRLREMEPSADVGSRMISYARDNNLSGDEVNSGLAIMAAMKADPIQALAMLKPYYEALSQLAGEGELPEDLKKAVDDGRTEEQFARETAKNRAAAIAAENRRQHVEHRSTAEATQRVQQEATDRIKDAISTWEQRWAGSDPDFKVKQQRTLEKVEIAFLKGTVRVTTPQEAVALAEKCRKEVEDELKGFMPRRASMTPVTGVAAMTGATAKPTNILEAMRQAAGQ